MRCESNTQHPLITGWPRGEKGCDRKEKQGEIKDREKDRRKRERNKVEIKGRSGGWVEKEGEIEKGEMEVISGEIY